MCSRVYPHLLEFSFGSGVLALVPDRGERGLFGDRPEGAYFATPAFANRTLSVSFSCLTCAKQAMEIAQPRDVTSGRSHIASDLLNRGSQFRDPAPRYEHLSALLTNCLAVASQMPLLPPVTSAVFPSNLPMEVLLWA